MNHQKDYKAILQKARRTLHALLIHQDMLNPDKRRRKSGATREIRELPNVRQAHLDPKMKRKIWQEVRLERSFRYAILPRKGLAVQLGYRRHPRTLTLIYQHERISSNYFRSSSSSNPLHPSLPSSYNHADATEDAPEPMVF